MSVIGRDRAAASPGLRWRPAMPRRGTWPVPAAVLAVGCLVVLRPDRGDVAIYRQAARAAVSTGGVYDFQHQGHGFTYPPFAALMMASLAWLPNWAMWSALVGVGVASLVVVLALSAPRMLATARGRVGVRTLGLAALIVSEPVVTTLRFGQVDLALAALVMADILVFRRGVLVGLAVAVKLTPAIFVVLLVLRGRYREAATAVGVFAASVGWGFLVLPRPSVVYWTHNALAGTNVGSFTTVGNQSIHGIVSRVLGPRAGTAVWVVLAVPVAVAGLVLAHRVAQAGQGLLAVATTGAVACLVSPVSWPHHWIWFVPLLCGLWRMPGRDVLLTRWLIGAGVFGVLSQFTPIKAVGIGYVPLTIALLILMHRRLNRSGRATFT